MPAVKTAGQEGDGAAPGGHGAVLLQQRVAGARQRQCAAHAPWRPQLRHCQHGSSLRGRPHAGAPPRAPSLFLPLSIHSSVWPPMRRKACSAATVVPGCYVFAEPAIFYAMCPRACCCVVTGYSIQGIEALAEAHKCVADYPNYQCANGPCQIGGAASRPTLSCSIWLATSVI